VARRIIVYGWERDFLGFFLRAILITILIISGLLIIYNVYFNNLLNEGEIRNAVEEVTVLMILPFGTLLIILLVFSRPYIGYIGKESNLQSKEVTTRIQDYLIMNEVQYHKQNTRPSIIYNYRDINIIIPENESFQIRIEYGKQVMVWLGPVKKNNREDIQKIATELNKVLA